jgi:hypothetical protein
MDMDRTAAPDAALLVDPLNVAALRVVLGATEAEEATRLRKELAALKARVGTGAPDRPLHDDDVIELQFRHGPGVRVLVRHMPTELRTLCTWLAEGCTHQGQQFTLFAHPEHDEMVDDETEVKITEAIVAAAGLPSRDDVDDEEEGLMHYSNTMLTDTLSVDVAVFRILYAVAWAIQNGLHGKLLVPRGWARDVDEHENFVADHVVKALTLFGTGPLLQTRMRARKAVGNDVPNALTIGDVADAAHEVWQTIVEAERQVQAASWGRLERACIGGGGGALAARRAHHLEDYKPDEYDDPYCGAPRFLLVSEDDEKCDTEWEAARDHLQFA